MSSNRRDFPLMAYCLRTRILGELGAVELLNLKARGGKLMELCQLLVLTRIMKAAVLNGISSKELLVGAILL